MNLNPEQLRAAQQDAKNVLVLAGPGTGKTTALIGRYTHLIKTGVKPDQIFCCTFAKKASEEIKNGFKKRLGLPPGHYPLALSILLHWGFFGRKAKE